MKELRYIFSLVCLAAMLAVPQAACADDPQADALLSKLSQKISALGNYRVSFRADAEGNEMEGSYLVSGRRFRITTPGFDIIGDGQSTYEINHELQEVSIDVMDTTDVNILENPSLAFEFAAGNFSASYGGDAASGNVTCDVVNLAPLSEDFSIRSVALYIKRSDGLPLKLVYGIEGLDNDAEITVGKFEGGVEMSPGDFRFDRSKYRSYEVMDFR